MRIEQMKALLAGFGGRRLAVLGDVILDHYIWGDVGRISPEAPVPLVDVSHESHRLGGAANVALNLRTLGSRPALFGRIGSDSDGAVVRRLLEEAGIRLLGGGLPPAGRTIVKTRVIAQHQQLCRLDREGGRLEYTLGDAQQETVVAAVLEQAEGVLLSDYAKGLVDDRLLERLRKRAGERGIPVFCDPKPRFVRNFRGLHLLTPNRSEALSLSGIEAGPREPFPAAEVVAAIQERYEPRHLVITLGSDGMLYAGAGEAGSIVPAFAREVFDVSGAGDTVFAVLALSLLSGASLEESVILANTAAGVVVGKLGTSTVSGPEILAYAREHGLPS